MQPTLELGKCDLDFIQSSPFRLFSFQQIFSDDSFTSLRNAFEHLEWKEEKTHFYHQYSSVIDNSTNTPFGLIFKPSFFLHFKSKLEEHLGTTLRNACRLVALKLKRSQEIGVHNDYCNPDLGYENYRIVFQFAKPHVKVSGGELTFLNSESKDDIVKRYSYSSNIGICFQITPQSFHYVEPVIEDHYNLLVMYLWDAKRKYDRSGVEISDSNYV